MISLDSPRWKELRQAYGTAEAVPELLRAMEKEDAQRVAMTTSGGGSKSVWHDIWSSLCHQSSVYTATYAAVPYMVSVAKKGSLTLRLDVLVFCGIVQAFGNLVGGPVPADLIAEYETSLTKVVEMSRGIVSDAVREGLLDRFPLNSLVQSLLAIRYGGDATICILDRLGTGNDEIEVECSECGETSFVDLQSIPEDMIDRDSIAQDLKEAMLLVGESTGEPNRDSNEDIGEGSNNQADETRWSSVSIVQIAAAFAATYGDKDLADKIMLLRAAVACPSCDHQFMISDGILWGI
ncbi:MAG: hypothetical protein R3C24_12995 [Cyanobacteriota/Melainabacteria group bacterium]